MQAGDAGASSLLRRLESLDGSENADLTPIDSDSSSSFPITSIIVIAVGCVIFVGLVFLLVALRRGRNRPESTNDDYHPPENSRLCMKRTTFAVPSGLDEVDSSGSVVPVLGDNTSHCKMREGSQAELKPSWAEASAATSSYSVAPLSSRHTRPAVPVLIYTPARPHGLGDSHAASEYSSHADDYSIGMLESPVSTEYSFGSEDGDVFLSATWDEVDSYRSMNYTGLSTTSSDVFGSNRARNGGAWKQVYGPNDTPPGQSPLSSGVLFVRNIAPTDMRRMRLDTRANGARGSHIRFEFEV
ncbi:hypothetical protein PHMEG_0008137 [Phytophthora megakarya]|uniref:Uncharacterized protein n=1 Tax=Phytophthora megakarya TaxID=4795 RepID=A0A225WLZ4_9STRA|nr:hypothetical protein PHMEG_0008137 [Phytophthora megakarya]